MVTICTRSTLVRHLQTAFRLSVCLSRSVPFVYTHAESVWHVMTRHDDVDDDIQHKTSTLAKRNDNIMRLNIEANRQLPTVLPVDFRSVRPFRARAATHRMHHHMHMRMLAAGLTD